MHARIPVHASLLIEDDVTRGVDAAGTWIEQPVRLCALRIADEDHG